MVKWFLSLKNIVIAINGTAEYYVFFIWNSEYQLGTYLFLKDLQRYNYSLIQKSKL